MEQQKQSRGDAQAISEQDQASAHGTASDLTSQVDPGSGRTSSTDSVERRLRFIEAVPRELRKQVGHLDRRLERLNRGYIRCLDTAAKCQEQATQSLNHALERHALNPAIETVVSLAEELFRLRDVALQPNTDDQPAGRLQTLAEEINISAQIAQEKLDYLDIAHITPSRADPIDPKKHSICRCTDTKDKTLHGTVSQLVRPGVMYRGEVLRPAAVAVFRYCELNDEQNKTKTCV
jgi:molecular chaperone GrpE (heat shock protein)